MKYQSQRPRNQTNNNQTINQNQFMNVIHRPIHRLLIYISMVNVLPRYKVMD